MRKICKECAYSGAGAVNEIEIEFLISNTHDTAEAEHNGCHYQRGDEKRNKSGNDYFEIFLGRMILCRGAAEKLGLSFRLIINDQQLF